MRPPSKKITPEIRARCREVAVMILQRPKYKELEIETGINRNYLAKIVHQELEKMRSKEIYVSREMMRK